MKNTQIKNYCGLAVATLLLGGASLTFADTADLTIQDFTANANGTGVEWGSSTVALDSANGNPAGSLLFTVTMGSGSDSPMVDYVCIAGGNPWYQPTRINFSTYTNIQFDIKWDPTSDITIAQFNDLSTWPTTLAPAGSLSGSTPGIELQLCGGPAGQRGPSIGFTNIPAGAASGWVHCAVPINPAQAQIDGANGVVFNKWIAHNGGITNPVVVRFWIDNVVLGGIHGPIPPPKVSLAPAYAGLHLFAGTAGGNDRENIRAVGTAAGANYAWVGHGSTPVSYSFTITNYPGSDHPYFMINEILVAAPCDPVTGALGTVGLNSAPDWAETNCLFLDFESYPNNVADWRFRWKTNSIPDGNGSYYSGVLADLNDPSGPLGTWTLTFVNNTNVTMTHTQNGTSLSTNFVFSEDKLAGWVYPAASATPGAALPLYYYVGCRGNGSGATTAAVLSEVKIQGSTDTLDDIFPTDTALDTNKWEVIAAYGPSIQMVPATPKPVYWVNWTLPANGFSLISSPSLTGPWTDSATAPLAYAGVVKSLVTASTLPSADQGYFRLVQRVASQLQVLLPGETNAPGTLTGKVGTPDPVSLGGTFPTVTVNAVDATWHIVPGAAAPLSFSSTDPTPAVFSPATPSLANGTATTVVMFGAEGSWTITATDTSTNAPLSAGTSSSVTVGP